MKNSTLSHDRHNSPLWPRYHPIWFKTLTLKDNCLFELLLGKKGEKNNISQFSATHTHIKLTFVSFFSFIFWHLSPYQFLDGFVPDICSLTTRNRKGHQSQWMCYICKVFQPHVTHEQHTLFHNVHSSQTKSILGQMCPGHFHNMQECSSFDTLW